MKKLIVLLVFLMPSLLFGQKNLQLLSTYNTTGQRLSGCWHYADSAGNVYGLIGAEMGIMIFDITQPSNPQFLFQLPGNRSIWHEVKVAGQYAYAVSEGFDTNGVKNGLQIIDLRYLPDSVPNKFWQGNGLIAGQLFTGHTVTAEGNYVYINGHNVGALGRGVLICNINDPWNPVFEGAVTQNYCHDSYVRGDTIYTSDINAGQFSVYDISNRSNPVLLATQPTPGAFNHNTWLSDNGQTIFTTDEVSNTPLTAYDISDLSNIQLLDTYFTLNFPSSEVHNVRVMNDFLINPSYGSQLTITDAARPDNLIEVGNYTTGSYLCWDADPFLPNGAILATDMNSEMMFLFQPNYVRACYLEGLVTDSVTGLGLPNAAVTIIGHPTVKYSNSNGDYRTGIVDTGSYTVQFSRLGYNTKTISGVTLQTGVVTSLNAELSPSNISVPETNLSAYWKVFPNPTLGKLNFESRTNNPVTFNLLNMSGQTVRTFNLNGNPGETFTVDVSGIASGVYTLRMFSEQVVASQRIIIN